MAGKSKVSSTTSGDATTKVVAKKSTKKPRHPLCGVIQKVAVEGKKGKKLVCVATASWPFETVPTDYSFRKFRPLTKKDFKGEAGFFDYLAAMLTEKASIMKTKADEARLQGDSTTRKDSKRLAAVAAQTEALIAKLGKKMGADVVAKIIANAKAKVEKAAADATAAEGATA